MVRLLSLVDSLAVLLDDVELFWFLDSAEDSVPESDDADGGDGGWRSASV